MPFANAIPDLTTTRNTLRTTWQRIVTTTTLAAGAFEDVLIYAPAGSIYTLTALRLLVGAVPTASTGFHRWQIRPFDSLVAAEGRAVYNSACDFDGSQWNIGTGAGSFARPDDRAAALLALQACIATVAEPFRVRYQNEANAAQTASRTVVAVFREEALGE